MPDSYRKLQSMEMEKRMDEEFELDERKTKILDAIIRNYLETGEPVPEFPYNWQYDGANGRSEDAFQMDIYCRSLLLIFKDSGAVDAGRADVFVDDTKVLTADPHVNGWTHCNPVILLEEKESGWHQVRIQMTPGEEEKKFTILGFGYVE